MVLTKILDTYAESGKQRRKEYQLLIWMGPILQGSYRLCRTVGWPQLHLNLHLLD